MSQELNNLNNSDVCEACGSIVELGSIITEHDTVLVLPFSGASQTGVNALAQKYTQAAKARFDSVRVSLVEDKNAQGFSCVLTLKFECTAEKLIFEMGMSAI